MCTQYTLKGLAKGCKDSIGGINKVWLASDYESVMGGVSVEDNVAVVASEKVAGFKVFNFFRNTGSMTSTLQTSENAGNYWQTEVALQFMKMQTATRLEIEAMVMGECAGIVRDSNGKYWFLGMDNALTASAGTAQTGTASGDLNGYNVTLIDESKALPYEITDEDTIAALEAIVVA